MLFSSLFVNVSREWIRNRGRVSGRADQLERRLIRLLRCRVFAGLERLRAVSQVVRDCGVFLRSGALLKGRRGQGPEVRNLATSEPASNRLRRGGDQDFHRCGDLALSLCIDSASSPSSISSGPLGDLFAELGDLRSG